MRKSVCNARQVNVNPRLSTNNQLIQPQQGKSLDDNIKEMFKKNVDQLSLFFYIILS